MSIASEIERIKSTISAAYLAAEEKGATMPEVLNSDNLPTTIASITGGAASGKALSSLTAGAIVSILEDGKLTPFYVAKHDYEAELNGNGRTLLVRKDLHSQRVWNNTDSDAYASSSIDAWLNGDYKNTLSVFVKANMGATTFKYTPGGGDKTVANLAKSVFLLSVTEFGFTYDGANVEGSALPIGGTLRVGYLDGVAYNQWTRSPSLLANNYVCNVLTNGNVDYHPSTNIYRAARPCFTLPGTMEVYDEPLPDGTWLLKDGDMAFDTTTASTTAKSGVTYTNGIADLNAATLNEIGKAISSNPNITNETSTVYYDKGDVHRKISVGDTMNTTYVESGTTYTVPVNIIGFNHDDLSLSTAYEKATATGKAGLTFQTVDCVASQQMNGTNTNVGGWSSTWLRTTYLVAYFNGYALNSVIKGVKKLTSAGNKSAVINTTNDTLFLLSEIEVFGSVTHSFAGEGTQYAYYKAGNSNVKKVNGAATLWWERGPSKTLTTAFDVVNNNGTANEAYASEKCGLAFAFCI